MEKVSKRILVVDDKPNNLSLVTSLLRPHYEVLLANNGERALQIARDQLPDLILLDIMMPGMSGFEVCAALKDKSDTAEIPVIFLTARNDNDDFEKAYDIGAVDYTTKPINAKELMMRVKTHLLIAEQKNRLLGLNEKISHINEELEREVAKRTEALSRAKENLERQNLDLAQFSLIVSHNLRGPVASALGLAQLFDRKNLSSPVNSEILDRLIGSIWDIDNMLKDVSLLLDIRENLPSDFVNFKPSLTIKSVVSEKCKAWPSLSQENFEINLGVSEITTYKSYFEKILFQLIDNAICFHHPDRKLQIKISLTISDNFYQLDVADNGVGIETSDFNRIFEPFRKLSYESKGRGLGLYQVKTMVNNLGGVVGVASRPGVGSVFSVKFPMPAKPTS